MTKIDYDAIQKAVDEYAAEIGVKKIRVTLGPNATPENVVAELRKVHDTRSQFYAIPEYFRDQWQIKKLRSMLREIQGISNKTVIDEPTSEDMKAALRKI